MYKFIPYTEKKIYIYIYLEYNQLIGLVSKVFANGVGDLGSIPGHVIPKTLKMVLDTSLLNTLHFKVHIKGKVSNPLWLSVVAIGKGAFWLPSTMIANFIYYILKVLIVIGNGNPSSNSGWFQFILMPLVKTWIHLLPQWAMGK